jgi:hypothetical protein
LLGACQIPCAVMGLVACSNSDNGYIAGSVAADTVHKPLVGGNSLVLKQS